jgi:uncharacterized RDD family membrane protein YckC
VRSVYDGLPGSERYAGFWIRVFADVLDVLLFGAVNMAVMMTADEWWPRSLPPGVGSVSGPDPRVGLVTMLLPIVAIVSSWIALGASPGKILLGLRIIDEPTGGRPTPWQCVGRYVDMMRPGLVVAIVYADDDLIDVEIAASNGVFAGAVRAVGAQATLAALSERL